MRVNGMARVGIMVAATAAGQTYVLHRSGRNGYKNAFSCARSKISATTKAIKAVSTVIDPRRIRRAADWLHHRADRDVRARVQRGVLPRRDEAHIVDRADGCVGGVVVRRAA